MDSKTNSEGSPGTHDNEKSNPKSESFDQNKELIEPSGSDLENQAQKLPYPKSVFFIVSNEFCERFSFYGMRTILPLYLRDKLGFSEGLATVTYHAFIMICYFFPLLGAIIADSWLGKYKTILYLSIVYAIGNTVVSTAAIPYTLPKVPFTMIGLVLIALGTGGIKPCVSAFGGDQFVLPQQEDQLQKFFSLFYFAINSGSFVSTFLTPILREIECFGNEKCYSLAFGVPAMLMILAIIIYFCGKRWYKIKEPEGNVVIKVSKCMWYAATKKSLKTYDHWLDKAQDKFDKKFIEDIKAALRVLVLYIPLPIFWALFDQQGSRWTFQADRMNGQIGSFTIQPDQMQVVNPVLILVFIPLFQTVVYPCFAKCNLLKRPLQRLTVGGILAATAFAISAVIETQLENVAPAGNQITLYNGLPGTVDIEIPTLDHQRFKLDSLDVWQEPKNLLSPEDSFSLSYTDKGAPKNETLHLFEDNASSYIILPDRILPIMEENYNKTHYESPKIMIIYSEDVPFESRNISFYDLKKQEETFYSSVTYSEPYVNYKIVEGDHFTLKVDGQSVLDDIKLKKGGEYVALVMKNDNKYSAKVIKSSNPNTLHILWLIPQYVIITAGEVMFSITGLEFSFTQAPVTMKSLLQAAWLITVALGNLIVVIIAQIKFFESQIYEYLLFAGLMFLDMFIFALMAMRYTYVEDLEEHKEEENN